MEFTVRWGVKKSHGGAPAVKSVMLQMDVEYLTIAQMATENYKLNTRPESLGIALANKRGTGKFDMPDES